MRDAQRDGDPLHGPTVRAAFDAVCAASPLVNWTSAEGAFLFYRLALVLPFPAAVCPGAAHANSLAAALGRLFDAVCVRDASLRPLANYWVDWAGHAYASVASVYRDAVDALS